MYIPIILGAARQGRQSEKAVNFLLEEAEKFGLEGEIIDVRDYRIKATDNSGESPEARKLAEKIKKADGLIIVSPEYNHGYPGELKMMLDMLYQDYFYKPVGFCGVSAGPLGGARAVEQLRLVAAELRMIPSRETVYFSAIQNLFDEEGKLKEKSYYEITKKFFDELIRLIEIVKKGRE